MSHPAFPDFDFSSITNKNANDFSVAVLGISVAETIGERDSQQDTIFVAKVKNEEACANPKTFFEGTIAEIVNRHKTCVSGTTLCSAIVTPSSEEDSKTGKTFPKITIANLGDSRAAIVAKMRDGRYISIILTEDHDLNVPRIRGHVERSGGRLAHLPEDPSKTPRVVYHSAAGSHPTLNMGAAIGDCDALGAGGRHVLMTVPDIFEYDLNAFPFVTISPDGSVAEVLSKDQILELDLIISCDGLYDIDGSRKLAADFKACKMDREIAFPADKVRGAEGLSEIKKTFDEESAGEFSLAAVLQDFAMSEGSRDNISIACVSLVSAGENQIAEPLMATVCDGHGNKSIGEVVGVVSPDSSGEEVSASVAAAIYLAAEAEHIAGLEVPRGHFHAFLTEAGVKIPTSNCVTRAVFETPSPFANVGAGGGSGGGGEGADSPLVVRADGAPLQRARGKKFLNEEEAKCFGFTSPAPSPEVPTASAAEALVARTEGLNLN